MQKMTGLHFWKWSVCQICNCMTAFLCVRLACSMVRELFFYKSGELAFLDAFRIGPGYLLSRCRVFSSLYYPADSTDSRKTIFACYRSSCILLVLLCHASIPQVPALQEISSAIWFQIHKLQVLWQFSWWTGSLPGMYVRNAASPTADLIWTNGRSDIAVIVDTRWIIIQGKSIYSKTPLGTMKCLSVP